jgi:hypothetical protein
LTAFVLGGAGLVITCVAIAILYKPAPYRVTFPMAFVWLALSTLFGMSGTLSEVAGGTVSRWRTALCYLAFLLFAAPIVRAAAATSQQHKYEAALVTSDFRRYAPPESRVHVWWGDPPSAEFLLLPFREAETPFNWIGVGWVINSPLGSAQLRRWGVGQLEKDLCRRTDFALFSHETQLQILSSFLHSRYDMNVHFEKIFSGQRLEVYRCVEDSSGMESAAQSGVLP